LFLFVFAIGTGVFALAAIEFWSFVGIQISEKSQLVTVLAAAGFRAKRSAVVRVASAPFAIALGVEIAVAFLLLILLIDFLLGHRLFDLKHVMRFSGARFRFDVVECTRWRVIFAVLFDFIVDVLQLLGHGRWRRR